MAKKIAKPTRTSLYFDKDDHAVYLKREESNYHSWESFIPTIDFVEGDVGYVVAIGYTTYDTFGSDENVRYEVVDAYKDVDAAHNVAQEIQRFVRQEADQRFSYKSKKEDFTPFAAKLADGSDYTHTYSFIGWGTSFRHVLVNRFTLGTPAKTVYGRY